MFVEQDINITWNSDDPDFTPCFEKTVLVLIPCAFLWIFLPLEIYYLRRTKAYNIPFNLYNIVKLVRENLNCVNFNIPVRSVYRSVV